MRLRLAERAGKLLGAEPMRASPIAGGDLSEVVELELDDGRLVVAKGSPFPAAEAEMLDAMRATGAPSPVVYGYDDAIILLERVANDGNLGDAWCALGRALAKLHAAKAGSDEVGKRPVYGWHCDYAFGSVAIENGNIGDWPAFWAERRLLNQVRFIPAEPGRRIERLAGDLANRLPANPVPALLHGDLWRGNILVADGRISALIDPACYYGDREVDFAMLGLFGDIDARLFAGAGALAPGHYDRLPIYQLWPAIVHLRLFGAAYRPMIERLLDNLGV